MIFIILIKYQSTRKILKIIYVCLFFNMTCKHGTTVVHHFIGNCRVRSCRVYPKLHDDTLYREILWLRSAANYVTDAYLVSLLT